MRKTVIIGGVAGGASCAARLRRQDAEREIVMLERGKYISYANCGLPYHVSGVIRNRSSLLLMTPELMRDRFNIDVRVENEVTSINRADKTVTVKNRATGAEYTESYDDLVIATGSSPLRPRIEGIDSDKIRTLWTVPDTDEIRAMVKSGSAKTAAVIGGGFIGLEMAENLRHAGLQVSLIEAANQVMAPIDFEMAQLLHENIRQNGVSLYLGDGVAAFEDNGNDVTVKLQSGKTVNADLVILAIGVRPNSALAKDAGLSLNQRGGIIVDNHMRTDDEHIYAVGDVIEVEDFVSKERTMVPLAGPANKQGRIVADVLAGRESTYKGTQGSSVAKVFDLTAASTGANEKTLIRRGLKKHTDYETLIITQNSHAGYYPGAVPLTMKVIFNCADGKLLGAQIVGRDGVDKRIDTLGVALRFGATTDDLKDLELAYAPPYSSAKDPVNMAGFVAENIRTGMVKIAEVDETENADTVLLDVREEAETMAFAIPNAVNIPLGRLRENLGQLDRSKKIIVFCAIGVRAYNGARILMQNGFENVKIYPGGVRFYEANHPVIEETACEKIEIVEEQPKMKPTDNVKKVRLDCCGMQCPGPIMEVFQSVKSMNDGDILEVTASDPGFAKDVASWCRRTGNTLLSNEEKNDEYIATIQRGTNAVPQASAQETTPDKGKTIIVFDGDMDKVLASFVIANGALAMGRPVTMFFTFWGLTALRRDNKVKLKKNFMEKMFGAMLPRGSKKLKLSKMNMGGMGTAMMKKIMKDKNIDSLEDMMKKAMENGVKIIACSMSMDVMGIRAEELIDGVEIGGVGTYLGDAEESDVNLFI
ncbi:MAG: FAD-dependent oxidoreductase [Ruminococcus sp.]|nr:FAD-dependent oxidoreductase [uncultured Ruminococcus sp.]MBQ1616162.1 FAD-dependent oxidoreductase [Ruminococcus sp.]MBQ4261538.1 FAD-dependent oxidoreductase [Ruminococcus sp.]